MGSRSRAMTDDEINEVVSRLLRKQFEDLEFEYATAESEEDYDGASIIRVKTYFRGGTVPARQLIDAVHEIRTELIRRGEQRFVFLDTVIPYDREFVDEDVE
jgi:hypothetical protein